MIAAYLAWIAPALATRLAAAALRRDGARSAWPLGVALLLQDAAVVAEGMASSALLPAHVSWLLPLAAHLFYGLDAALLLVGNLRLEPTSFRYLRDAQRLLPAGAVPWLWAAALALGCDAAALSAWYQPPGEALLWAVAAPGLLAAATWATRRQSPARLQAWSNGLFDWQLRALAHRQAAPPQPQPASPPQGAVLPDYPLLRRGPPEGALVHPVEVAPGERPHVVLLFLESFRHNEVGALGDDRGLTPHFDALAREGLLYTRYYTQSHATSRSVMSGLYGVVPPLRTRPTLNDEKPPHMLGLPQMFARRGYDTAFFHNGPAQFEDLGAFLQARGVRQVHDDAQIRAMFPQAKHSQWGCFDEHLYEYHASWLKHRDAAGIPTFSTLLTMTHHYPWQVPETLRDAPANANDLCAEARFALTCRYADQCLGAYMDMLRAAGLDKKTVFVITGDTGQQMDENFGTLAEGGYLRDACYHIPMLIWAPGRLHAPARIPWLASHSDLLQTVFDLLGVHQDLHHGMGESLLRLQRERTLLLSQPERPQLWGARHGRWRFNHYLHPGSEALFDVQAQPQEDSDLAAQHPEVVAALHAEAKRQYLLTERLFAEDKLVPADLAATPPVLVAMETHLLPISLPQAQAWLQALEERPEHIPGDVARYKVLRVTLASPGLDDAARLQYVRLRLKKLHRADLGPLTREEAALLEVYAEAIDNAA